MFFGILDELLIRVEVMIFKKLYTGIMLLLCIFAVGCQPKVYLMPSPVGMRSGAPLFDLADDNKDKNLLTTLYATNREPVDESNRSGAYTIFPSENLRLGFVVDSVGGEGRSWDEIYEISLQKKRSEELLLKREYVREMASYHLSDDLRKTSPQADGFFYEINELLKKRVDKDILVYVHGANSNFYRATAQGAQLFHFTGHNSIVLTFSWPSAENLLRYKTDVLHAKETIPAFARLIELLAHHTIAKNINIIAYSAGAQVAAPGLAYFHDEYPNLPKAELKKKLRIGEVYFAAPDTALEPFVERYLKFKDIVERVTLNVNTKDSVLRFSALLNHKSRLGRPDISELTDEEFQILIDASETSVLNILDVSGSKSLKVGGAHDSWYGNPWVSSDLLILLLLNEGPLERGLEAYKYEGGVLTYRFPDDYDLKLQKFLDENRSIIFQKLQAERTK